MYAHYGLASDYDELESLGISVSGKIVLARYGEAFRGNIVCHHYNNNIPNLGGVGSEERSSWSTSLFRS